MQDLREVLEEAGYGEVRTLHQSGNVVLTSCVELATLEQDLANALGNAFGFDIAVVVRTRDELADVIARDPLSEEAEDPARYQVSFLAAEPNPARVHQLEHADVAPERVVVRGREIYAWHPDGIARSRLAALITEQHLGVEVTARNWRTATKMLELADDSES